MLFKLAFLKWSLTQKSNNLIWVNPDSSLYSLYGMDLSHNLGDWLKVSYLIFTFCSALSLGALKGSHNLFHSFYLYFYLLCHLGFQVLMFLLNYKEKKVEKIKRLVLEVFMEFCWTFAGFLVGPIAGLILIIGNVGVILGLLPAHVMWTVYTLVK